MKNHCRRASAAAAAGGYVVRAVFPKHVGAYALYYGTSGRPLSEGDIAARPLGPDEVFRMESEARAFMDSEFGG